MNLYTFSILMIGLVIGSFGAVFLKLGSKKFKISISLKFVIDLIKNWRLILGLFLYALSTIFFIYTVKFDELSVIYPLTSISYIFVTFLSVYFLKEKLNIWKFLGITFIILGVFLVRM